MWRSKTGSIGKFTFEVYYDLLWNAAYQHNLNKATKKRELISFLTKMVHVMIWNMILKRKTLHMIKIKTSLHHTQFSIIQSTGPRRATKIFIPCQLWGEFPEAMTEFRQPLQVQSHLEMPGILVQLGHIQRT